MLKIDMLDEKTWTYINNTHYNCGTSSEGYDVMLTLAAQYYTSCIVRNNIFYLLSIDSNNYHIACPNGYGSGVDIDHNLFYQDSGTCPGGCEHGDDAVEDDPDFTDKGNDVFTLQDGSPAINAGSSTGAPSDDYVGTSRPQGVAVEIGAYEHPEYSPPEVTEKILNISGTLVIKDGYLTYIESA